MGNDKNFISINKKMGKHYRTNIKKKGHFFQLIFNLELENVYVKGRQVKCFNT